MRNARKDKGADASGSYRNREDPNLVGVESTGTPTSVRFVRLEDCNVNLEPQRRGKVKGGLKKRSSRLFWILRFSSGAKKGPGSKKNNSDV